MEYTYPFPRNSAHYTMSQSTAILAIETSNPGPVEADALGVRSRAGVALGLHHDGGGLPDAGWVEVLGEQGLRPVARHDDALLPAISRLLDAHSMGARDLSRVAVSVGPGGYTSIRIAVTVAKMICEATGALCVPVPTGQVVLAGVSPEIRAASTVVVCLAWKRDSVWRAVAPAGGGLQEGEIVALDDVLAGCDTQACLVGEPPLIEMLRARVAVCKSVRIVEPRFSPTQTLTLGARLQPVDPAALMPMYPREPEAVTKWRALGRERLR